MAADGLTTAAATLFVVFAAVAWGRAVYSLRRTGEAPPVATPPAPAGTVYAASTPAGDQTTTRLRPSPGVSRAQARRPDGGWFEPQRPAGAQGVPLGRDPLTGPPGEAMST